MSITKRIKKIALLGSGKTGQFVATDLLKAGHEIVVFNRQNQIEQTKLQACDAAI